MNRIIAVFLLGIAGALLYKPNALAADQGIAVDYLVGEGDLTGLRLAYRPYYTQITQIDWLGGCRPVLGV